METPIGHIKEQLQLRGVLFTNASFKTQHYDAANRVVKDKRFAVKTLPGMKKADLIRQVMEMIAAGKWNKKKRT